MTAVPHLIVALAALLLMSACHDDDWEAFKSQRHCKIVEKMDGDTTITSGGHLVFNSAKDGWLCDDGITYWKDRE